MSIGKAVMFVNTHILMITVRKYLLVRLANLIKLIAAGYWNKPAETAKAFHGRYLLTGDLAKMDNDGDIFVPEPQKRINHNWWRKCLTIRSQKLL